MIERNILNNRGALLWLLLSLVILLGGVWLHTSRGYSHFDLSGHAWGSDDAYISYRYARNLAEGHGLVFNPGERVEGYSNFLYVLLLTPLFWLLPDTWVYGASVLLNVGFAVTALMIWRWYLGRWFGKTAVILGSLLFVLTLSLWVWVSSGLETPLILFLLLLTVAALDRTLADNKALPLLCAVLALLILARADGFITPLVVVGFLALQGRWRSAWITGLTVALTIAFYFVWRYAYYGYWLPNTFYVKVSGPLPQRLSQAWQQLQEIAWQQGLGFWLIVVALALGVVIWRMAQQPDQWRRFARFELLLAVVWLGYWFFVGGDVFGERFLLVLFPLGVFLLFWVGNGRYRDWVIALALFALLWQLNPLRSDGRFDYTTPKYDRWVTLGQFLQAEYPEASLAVDAAGKMPYFTNTYTLDMLGLTDEFLAHGQTDFFEMPGHNKYNVDYILSRQPDVITAWFAPCPGGACDFKDMTWDLTRERYEAAGYTLHYVVNVGQFSLEQDIVDVAGWEATAVGQLRSQGYAYAVLTR